MDEGRPQRDRNPTLFEVSSRGDSRTTGHSSRRPRRPPGKVRFARVQGVVVVTIPASGSNREHFG